MLLGKRLLVHWIAYLRKSTSKNISIATVNLDIWRYWRIEQMN
jgi:hypothetical protein